MSGDGVSLPTTITQLGQLAKAQARSQQAGTNTPGNMPAEDKKDLQPVRQVKEAEPKGKRTLQRKREGGGRQTGQDADPADDQDRLEDELAPEPDCDQDTEQDPDAAPSPGLGGLIDTKA